MAFSEYINFTTPCTAMLEPAIKNFKLIVFDQDKKTVLESSKFTTISWVSIEVKYRKSMMSNKNQWWHRNLRSFKAKSSQCLVSPDNNLGTLCNVQKQTDSWTPNRIWWNQVPIRRAIYRRFAPRAVATCNPPQLAPSTVGRRLQPAAACAVCSRPPAAAVRRTLGSCGDAADYFCRHLRCHRPYLYNSLYKSTILKNLFSLVETKVI